MFEIFSVGDSAYLQAVLNAVAMIAGTGDYRTASAVGGLIGVLIIMLRALMQWDGRGIRYQDMFLAYVLWLALYAPSVRVFIEDAYTGSVVTVDNVPLGPAVVGSVMSNMGYRTTRLFEQAFSMPTMTGHGFADSLQTLTAVRKNLLSRIGLGSANAPNAGSDMESSFANYVKECTLTGVDLNLKSVDAILRDSDPLSAIRFDSDIYMTEISVGGVPQVKTCTDAWTDLGVAANGAFAAALENVLHPYLGVPAAADSVPKIQAAFDALAGPGVVNATNFMLMSAILPMFEKGVVGRHEDAMHWTKASMIEQAIQQRNTQWAAEQTMFSRIRPMMAFIEGLSYAIAPIMAFVILFGSVGLKMNVGYFSMLLWIQLWMPILAVINLFINMSAAGKMVALTSATYNLPSMYGIYQMDMELQQWLAIGGMLAASTPAITLMLIYRGAVTATHFLGRMDGSDYVNEKIPTPDIVSPASVLNAQPMHQYSPMSAVTLTGADKVLPTFAAGHDMSAAVSSAYSASEQATANFMSSLASNAGRTNSLSNEAFDTRALAHQIGSSSSFTDAYNRQFGEGFSKKYADTNISGDQFAAIISGSAGTPKDLLPTTISGRLQNDFQVGKNKADAIGSDISQTVNDTHGYQAGLARNLSLDAQSGTRGVASFGLQGQELSSLQKSASDTITASESYHQTVSAQQRFGAHASFGAAETGLKIAGDGTLMDRLDQALDHFGLRGDAQRLASEWKAAGWISDGHQAYAAAGMSLLTGFSSPTYRQLDAHQSKSAEIAGYQILGDAFHAPSASSDWNPNRNANLKDEAPRFGDIHSKVDQARLHDPRDEVSGIGGRVQGRMEGTRGRLAGGEATIQSDHDRNLGTLDQHSNDGFAEVGRIKSEHFRSAIASAANSMPSAAEFAYNYIGGGIYNVAKSIEGLGASASSPLNSFAENYNLALTKGASQWDALKYGASKSRAGFTEAVTAWADQRVSEVAGQLTPTQQAYYRAAMFESFAGISMVGDYGGDLGGAKQKLIQEEGETDGNNIAKLLKSAAGQNRMDVIGQIGNFNRARGIINY